MAMAALGALICMLITALLNRGMRRDLAWEWSQGMKIRTTDATLKAVQTRKRR
jgi:hypothetical protein